MQKTLSHFHVHSSITWSISTIFPYKIKGCLRRSCTSVYLPRSASFSWHFVYSPIPSSDAPLPFKSLPVRLLIENSTFPSRYQNLSDALDRNENWSSSQLLRFWCTQIQNKHILSCMHFYSSCRYPEMKKDLRKRFRCSPLGFPIFFYFVTSLVCHDAYHIPRNLNQIGTAWSCFSAQCDALDTK